MNGGPGCCVEERLRILVREVARWNRQINLVSRVDTGRRIDDLVRQCRRGWDLLAAAAVEAGVSDLGSAAYVDLGSGAGFPGLVWSSLRVGKGGGTGAASLLVEPRRKRAWFLQRTARLMDLAATAVHDERWGQGRGMRALPGAGVLVVSLKALRLDDRAVLGGLDGDDRPERWEHVLIARFLDPGEHTRELLEESFADPAAAELVNWRRAGLEILGDGNPGLALSSYHRA